MSFKNILLNTRRKSYKELKVLPLGAKNQEGRRALERGVLFGFGFSVSLSKLFHLQGFTALSFTYVWGSCQLVLCQLTTAAILFWLNQMVVQAVSTTQCQFIPCSSQMFLTSPSVFPVTPRLTNPWGMHMTFTCPTLKGFVQGEKEANRLILLPVQGWIVDRKNNTYCFSENK